MTEGKISERVSGIVEYRKPSFGNFFAAAQPLYWLGIAKSVSFPGLIMDINRYVSINVAKDNNPATAIAYNKQSGARLSAYEHLIPEKIFTDAAHPGQGMSAIKALAVASAQGQKIFTITLQNMATVLPQLTISPGVQMEIQNAVAAGKEATVSQSKVTVGGWTGVGYVITDPTTGAGAYKISGGANGGFIKVLAVTVLGIFLIMEGAALLASGAWILGGLLVLWEFDALTKFFLDLGKINNDQQFNELAAATVMTEIVGLIPALEWGGAIAAAMQYAFLILWAEFKSIWLG